MLVRETESGMSALLLDRETELWLMNLRVEGTVLKGSIMTSERLTELSLELREGMVIGTLTDDGKLLTIDGDRNNSLLSERSKGRSRERAPLRASRR